MYRDSPLAINISGLNARLPPVPLSFLDSFHRAPA